MRSLPVEDFMPLVGDFPVFDVRTPAEYAAGHIPGAINLPLFTNEERVIVGTIYKQQGREPAIKKGLELVGPKMRSFIEQVEEVTPNGTILTYCWRGGMRSGSMAWLLSMYGYDVVTLKRGYKAFRNWAIERFGEKRNIFILGGSTGSAKTQILLELGQIGEQVIDLEGLAAHKGSAFGWINEPQAPTQEQFENMLAMQWNALDLSRAVWLEDESRTIGKKVIPENVWLQMRSSPVIYANIPVEERVDFLVKTYGSYKGEDLEESILKIEKRLGNETAWQAIYALQDGNLAETARLLLIYYDKAYSHGLSKRDPETIHKIPCSISDIHSAALTLKNAAASLPIFNY
jgi:tRNA 2-selenouridine synthase